MIAFDARGNSFSLHESILYSSLAFSLVNFYTFGLPALSHPQTRLGLRLRFQFWVENSKYKVCQGGKSAVCLQQFKNRDLKVTINLQTHLIIIGLKNATKLCNFVF